MNRYAFLPFAILPVIVIAGVLTLHFFGQQQADSPTNRQGVEKESALYLEVRDNLINRWDGDVEPQKIDDGALVEGGQLSAALRDLDPTPVAAIEDFKRALS